MEWKVRLPPSGTWDLPQQGEDVPGLGERRGSPAHHFHAERRERWRGAVDGLGTVMRKELRSWHDSSRGSRPSRNRLLSPGTVVDSLERGVNQGRTPWVPHLLSHQSRNHRTSLSSHQTPQDIGQTGLQECLRRTQAPGMMHLGTVPTNVPFKIRGIHGEHSDSAGGVYDISNKVRQLSRRISILKLRLAWVSPSSRQ